MKTATSYISNISNLKPLVDTRYGKVLVVDAPDAARLEKLDVAYAVIDPGATSPPHFHERTEEAYAIVKGNAVFIVDGVATPVGLGDVIRIPTFSVHTITAGPDGCEFWVSTSPPYCINDDIETDAVTVDKPIAPRIKIAIIVGTNRAGSLTANIARQVVGMFGELDVVVDLIDLAELPRAIFDPESFTRRYETDSALTQRLASADGLVFLCPEYNGSFPGVLKHVMDVQNYEQCFGGKAACLVGIAAGDFGAVRALDHLAGVLGYRSANIYGKKTYIRNVDEAPMDENGYLTDPEIVGRLRAQAAGFAEFVRALVPLQANK